MGLYHGCEFKMLVHFEIYSMCHFTKSIQIFSHPSLHGDKTLPHGHNLSH